MGWIERSPKLLTTAQQNNTVKSRIVNKCKKYSKNNQTYTLIPQVMGETSRHP